MNTKNNEELSPVICLNTQDRYENHIIAAKVMRIKFPSKIISACRDESKVAGRDPKTNESLYWAFLDDYENGKRISVPEVRTISVRKPKPIRKVICLNNKQIFNSIFEAKEFYSISSTTYLNRACVEVNRSCGKHPVTGEKLYWAFLDDYENGSVACIVSSLEECFAR